MEPISPNDDSLDIRDTADILDLVDVLDTADVLDVVDVLDTTDALDVPNDPGDVDEPAGLTDEELALRVQQYNDIPAQELLLHKYKNSVRSRARSYFLIGADHEDIVQEGMIGLFKAIRDYRTDKQASFRAFAELCITRQIITAIKAATRQKHIPLNSYVSLNRPIYDEESERTLMDVITEGRAISPEEMLINREDYSSIELQIRQSLSELENQVLDLFLEGKSYQEIAQLLKRHVKSIDNALQRIKRKLEKMIQEQEKHI